MTVKLSVSIGSIPFYYAVLLYLRCQLLYVFWSLELLASAKRSDRS